MKFWIFIIIFFTITIITGILLGMFYNASSEIVFALFLI